MMFNFTETDAFNNLFSDMGYSDLTFIDNIGSMFFYMFGMIPCMLIVPLFKVLSKFNKVLNWVYLKLKHMFLFAFAIRFFLEGYLELSLCSFISI
jgi:hypothetical protein